MSTVGDALTSVLDGILREVGKSVAPRKRATRRKRAATPSDRLRAIEKLLRPAAKQTSRKKTTRTRSTTQQKRVKRKTSKLRNSYR